MKKIHNELREEIEIASKLYRDKSEKYHNIAMLWLIPLFIGIIIMSRCIKIGFIILIGSALISMFYSYLANKYLNKYRKGINRIFEKELNSIIFKKGNLIMVEKKSDNKFLCGTAPWISADITEQEYKDWIASIKRSRTAKVN